jgi:hypothetical protein
MPKRKVLTMTIELELGDRKAPPKRLQAVYDAAVEGAVAAATSELLEGGVISVQHRMTYDYRWVDKNSSAPIGDVDDWAEDEPA